ncbi:MAG: pilus assembly protein [Bosea sp.]|nr:pilus assembly protein [Bosea sp. (in: a-proteobacteria)]
MAAAQSGASAGAAAPARRKGRGFWRNNRGATAVEFGLIALPFLGLIAGLLETGLMMFADSALDQATNRAARMIRTGQAQQQNFNTNSFRNEVCSGGVATMFDCTKLKIDVRTATDFASMNLASQDKPDGSVDDASLTYNAGHGSDIVVVRTYYDWPILLNRLATFGEGQDGKTRRLTSTVAFRNEPFNW